VTTRFEGGDGVSSGPCFRDFLRGGGLIGRTGSKVCVRRAEELRVAALGVPVDVDSGVAIALSCGDIVSLGEDPDPVSLGNSDGDSLGEGEGERSGLSFPGAGRAFLWTFLCRVGFGPVKNLSIFSPNDDPCSPPMSRA
jgi:hypothetical protein